MGKKILVTGTAGFIGFHMARALCAEGHIVRGYDNVNDYYDVTLKEARLKELEKLDNYNFTFTRADLEDQAAVEKTFEEFEPEVVINLAAQAGVRYSLSHPRAYMRSNIDGFLNILECCRHAKISNLIYASSSSVYGANGKMPFAVEDNVDHPVSLYAATKKSNELMAHTYAHLYGVPCTGLRFFTVYGPWGRPDMAMYIFTKAIIEGQPIDVYNDGNMMRDFTYIDDIIAGMMPLIDLPAKANDNWDKMSPDPSSSNVPYALYNIGNNKPVNLLDMIDILEDAVGQKAEKRFLPLQPGDVEETYANIDALHKLTGFTPETSLEEGIQKFVDWYKEYHQT